MLLSLLLDLYFDANLETVIFGFHPGKPDVSMSEAHHFGSKQRETWDERVCIDPFLFRIDQLKPNSSFLYE